MKVLMVCLGNICRSPMAEGILRKLAKDKNIQMEVDSAGTGNWHSGEAPDRRAIATASRFGVDISKLVARQFNQSDFSRFDKIFVMDQSNYRDVEKLAKSVEEKNKIDLLLAHSSDNLNSDVPDPWFGDEDGFVPVYKLIEDACLNFLLSIEQNPKN